jgi:hypothetical protein
LIRLARRNGWSDKITERNAPFTVVFLGGKKKAKFGGAFEPGVLFAGQIGKL